MFNYSEYSDVIVVIGFIVLIMTYIYLFCRGKHKRYQTLISCLPPGFSSRIIPNRLLGIVRVGSIIEIKKDEYLFKIFDQNRGRHKPPLTYIIINKDYPTRLNIKKQTLEARFLQGFGFTNEIKTGDLFIDKNLYLRVSSPIFKGDENSIREFCLRSEVSPLLDFLARHEHFLSLTSYLSLRSISPFSYRVLRTGSNTNNCVCLTFSCFSDELAKTFSPHNESKDYSDTSKSEKTQIVELLERLMHAF